MSAIARFVILNALFASFSASCKKQNETTVVSQKTIPDISYGPNQRNKLDVFLPANRDSATPFVLMIHGGAWVAGDKTDMKSIQVKLLARGIASASMNYRYASNSVHYADLMEDVHNALIYCRSQSEEWKIRDDKFLLCGASAGGHLSLLYGYRYNPDNLVTGIMSAAGPTDLTDETYMNYTGLVGLKDEVEKITGAALTQPFDSSYFKASPIHNIRNVPTLMIHGTSDVVVFHSQSQALAAALQNAGIPHKLVSIQGANHDLNISKKESFDLIINELEDWVKIYGK